MHKTRVLERTFGPKNQDWFFSVKNEETDSFQSSQPFCSKKLESLPEYQNKIFIFQHPYKILIIDISNIQYDLQMCGIVFGFYFAAVSLRLQMLYSDQYRLSFMLCAPEMELKLQLFSPLSIPFSIASSSPHSPENENEAETWVCDISVRMFIWYQHISCHQNQMSNLEQTTEFSLLNQLSFGIGSVVDVCPSLFMPQLPLIPILTVCWCRHAFAFLPQLIFQSLKSYRKSKGHLLCYHGYILVILTQLL